MRFNGMTIRILPVLLALSLAAVMLLSSPRAEQSLQEQPVSVEVERIGDVPAGRGGEVPGGGDSAGAGTGAEKAEPSGKMLEVLDVSVRKAGKLTRAEIITDGTPVFNIFTLDAPNRIVVDMENARYASDKKDVRVVTPHVKRVRVKGYNDKVRVVFDYYFRSEKIQPYDVVKGKDRIVIFFGRKAAVTKTDAGKQKLKADGDAKTEQLLEAEGQAQPAEAKPDNDPAEEAGPEAPAEKAEAVSATVKQAAQVAEAEQRVEEAVSEQGKPVVEKKAEEERPKEEAKAYTGQRVTLEFKDADIKNVFRVIAEVSNYNILISDEIKGKITMRLVNVPWDQALDIILETNNLGRTKVGNVMRIVPLSVIKKEEEDRLATRKAREKLEDLVTRLIPVSYAKASDIAIKMKGVMTDRGSAEVDERTNTIILKDTQKSVDEALKLVKSIDTPTPQVVIEARIVEANTNFSKDLGVQWGTGYSADASHGNSTGVYFPNSYNILAGGGGSFALNPPKAGGVGAGGTSGAGGVMGINFGSINNTLNLDIRLSALESQGWGKVISSPKILTLDNKEAVMEQGVEIPYTTTSSSGTQTEFKKATLNLKVTPHVTSDGRIIMKVRVEKAAPSLAFTGAGGAPAIDSKSAETEILVKDGDTTVIGGIYQTNKGESESFVPFLGKIPVIGWFFKSRTASETKTELLIFITPRLLRETS